MSKVRRAQQNGADAGAHHKALDGMHPYGTPTVCYMCSSECGLLVAVSADGGISIRGNQDHPMNAGGTCPKAFLSDSLRRSPDRLKAPLKRVGPRGAGNFVPVSWDVALAEIGQRLREVKRSSGPEALTILFGENPAEARRFHWLWDGIRQARAEGMGLVVVDPYKSKTADIADAWLPIKPGEDVALILAILRHVIEFDGSASPYIDWNFVRDHTSGWDELKEQILTFERDPDSGYPLYSIEWASEKTGLPAAAIAALAHRLGATKPACAMVGMNGVSHHYNGFQATRALAVLLAITGNLDVPGGLHLRRPPPLNRPKDALATALGEQACKHACEDGDGLALPGANTEDDLCDRILAPLLPARHGQSPTAQLRSQGGVWSLPTAYRKYGSEGFRTRSGKVELMARGIEERNGDMPVRYAAGLAYEPIPKPWGLPGTTFRLITGRSLFHTHSITQNLDVPERHRTPVLLMNHDDAVENALASGDRVAVRTRTGRCIQATLEVTSRLRRGTLRGQHGWGATSPFLSNKAEGTYNINTLTSISLIHPISGNSCFGDTIVSIEKASVESAYG